MSVDLGDTFTTSIEVYTAPPELGGVLVNPSSVVLSILLPDGSTMAPAVVNTAPGKFKYDLITTQAGRHECRWVTTGPATAWTDVVNVDPAVTGNLVSLNETKEYLNIPLDRTTSDEELRRFITVASEFVEARTQLWHPTTIEDERYNFRPGGENVLILRRGPVTAVTSVQESGSPSPLSASHYELNPVGNYLLRTSGWWAPYVDVSYTVGAAVMPSRVRHATLVVLKHLWTTQRGALPMGGRANADEVYDPRSGYSFPRAVAEMLTDLGGSTNVYVG